MPSGRSWIRAVIAAGVFLCCDPAGPSALAQSEDSRRASRRGGPSGPPPPDQSSGLPDRKQARAVRVAAGSIRLDGRLDEEAWRGAIPITDFAQRQPIEGAPPTEPIDVRIAYDDGAIYVGARMSSSLPIQAPMGRRDEADQAEHLIVSLDTYLDRRTASTFGITAAGVRIDRYYASDDADNGDDGYNPVWEGQV